MSVEVKQTTPSSLDRETITSTRLPSWNDVSQKMLSLMSVAEAEKDLQDYFSALGDFTLRREPLARNGKAHHPFVLGTDQLIFQELTFLATKKELVSVLELGCGSSFGLVNLNEENQPPLLARALKLEFTSNVDITVSDRGMHSLYHYKDSAERLWYSIGKPKGLARRTPIVYERSLSAQYEARFGLSTISGSVADYEGTELSSYCLDEGKRFDIIYARNQLPNDAESYIDLLIKNVLPILNRDGVIVFGFDSLTGGSYNSREFNHTIIIRNNLNCASPDITLFDMHGKQIAIK